MRTKFFLIVICSILLLASCGQQAERPEHAQVGQLAPGFSLTDRQNKRWNLDKLKGQVVFVNFWATWCAPCREEMPSMQRLFASLPANKFKMLAILSNDEPAFADKVAEKLKVTFPILTDPGGLTGKAYGITGVPETYIIDREGILREKIIGPVHWDSLEARQLMLKYINAQ